jgi:hypothetical protein
VSETEPVIAVERPKSIHELLRARFSPPDWDLFSEVTIGDRRMDALAIGRSRPYPLWGIEVKAFRSDWLREIQNPLKADTLREVVDAWYLVAPADVAKPEEVPAGWGLLVPKGDTLRIVVRAGTKKRAAISRELLHRVLWQMGEKVTGSDFNATHFRARAETAEKALAEGTAGKDAAARMQFLEERFVAESKNADALRERMRIFSMTSGIPLHDDWRDGYALGQAVKSVMELSSRARVIHNIDAAEEAGKRLMESAAHARKCLEAVDAVTEKPVPA